MVLLPLLGVGVAMMALGAAAIGIMLVIMIVAFTAVGVSTFAAIMTGFGGSVLSAFVGLLPGKRLLARLARSRAA